MKKIMSLSVLLVSVMMLPAQGVYQLWGMTEIGGSGGKGVIFNTDADGNNFQLRHQFDFIPSPGGNPASTVPVEYNGKFYGMTSVGGSHNDGVIFEWDPVTNIYVDKVDFSSANGSDPQGSLALRNGKFYGLTSGQSGDGGGVIFEWDPATNVYTKKFDFNDFSTGLSASGSLTLNDDGKFYGMTTYGGSTSSLGVIFEWDPTTNVYTKKFDFTNDSGSNPWGSLTLSNGKFYGMTLYGGSNGLGTIFEWDPSTNVFTKKIDFNGANGNGPLGDLTLDNGKFYGMTQFGGGNNNYGVIFEWDPLTNVYTKKIALTLADGVDPRGSLTLSGGKFYGMTLIGGSNDQAEGTIFEWDPVSNVYTRKIDFDGINGGGPWGSLATGNGKLYGMTNVGGFSGQGVIFEWDPITNMYSKKIDFGTAAGNPGAHPFGSLVSQGGKLYGMTNQGGATDKGVIFEWDPSANEYSKKIDFDGTNGRLPMADLTSNGSGFYGMTEYGGSNEAGVIFQWDPATNLYTKKIDLNFPNGGNPFGNLTLYGGKFYGMAATGGDKNGGVIFELDTSTNVYTKKIDLDSAIGFYPFGNLTEYGGKFYGLTQYGGANNFGVIFEWDPVTNVYTKKIDFNGANGSIPHGSLTLHDGKLYGMTETGGSNNAGIIFEWDPATNIYAKKIDFNFTGGHYPESNLTFSDGKFYGMTWKGGDSDNGVIFEWDPETNAYSEKKAFDGTDGGSPFIGNALTRAPAPVTNGIPGSCASFPSVTIDNSNNNKWVAIIDNLGNAVAEIKANGNNLGIVSASVYINTGAVREDSNKKLYLDRNITLTSQVQPTSPVDIRLYIKGSEYLALQNAFNSNHDPSGISSIGDISVYKDRNNCSPAILALTDTIYSSSEAWGVDYVFTAAIDSFSSFYFAKKIPGCPPPIVACTRDTAVYAMAGRCGAEVRFELPVVTDACETATLQQTAGLHSGAFFPLGTTINKFVATSSTGKKDSCTFTVTVIDNKPPFITPVWAYPALLWPPDHKMKNVAITYFAWDNCGAPSCSLDVSSNEPVLGTGYGDKAPDWKILDDHHVELRAERSGHGNGRIYTITVTCTDASGNTSTRKTRVLVPRELHGHYFYNFDEENDDHINGNGDYFDKLLDAKVTPNPSTQNFNLQIESASDEKIEVNLYDISGRFISKLKAVKDQTYRFGNDLRPGMYMVEIIQGQQRKTIKVVKE